jgi:hypothetical protein
VLSTLVTATGGTVPRSMGDRSGDNLNAFDFGAAGDGITDDTQAIRSALLAASGKRLFIPPGVFLVDGISIPANTTVCGSGHASTTIKLIGGSTEDVVSIDSAGVSLSELTIDGNKSACVNGEHGVSSAYLGSQNIYINISGIRVKNCRKNGLNLTGNGIYSVANIGVYQCDGEGVVWAISDSKASGLDVGDVGLNGFVVTGGSNSLSGCKAWFTGMIDRTNSGDGFSFGFNYGSIFSNLTAQNVGRHGFYLNGTQQADACLFIGLVAEGNQSVRTVVTSGLVLGCKKCSIIALRAGPSVGSSTDQFDNGIKMTGGNPNENRVICSLSDLIAEGINSYVPGTSTQFECVPFRADFPPSPGGYNAHTYDKAHIRCGQLQLWKDAGNRIRAKFSSANPSTDTDGPFVAGQTNKGTTAQRPAGLGGTDVGVKYFDVTLAANGKPIFWTGSLWVDATGASV